MAKKKDRVTVEYDPDKELKVPDLKDAQNLWVTLPASALALAITGTGIAYRNEMKDWIGKIFEGNSNPIMNLLDNTRSFFNGDPPTTRDGQEAGPIVFEMMKEMRDLNVDMPQFWIDWKDRHEQEGKYRDDGEYPIDKQIFVMMGVFLQYPLFRIMRFMFDSPIGRDIRVFRRSINDISEGDVKNAISIEVIRHIFEFSDIKILTLENALLVYEDDFDPNIDIKIPNIMTSVDEGGTKVQFKMISIGNEWLSANGEKIEINGVNVQYHSDGFVQVGGDVIEIKSLLDLETPGDGKYPIKALTINGKVYELDYNEIEFSNFKWPGKPMYTDLELGFVIQYLKYGKKPVRYILQDTAELKDLPDDIKNRPGEMSDRGVGILKLLYYRDELVVFQGTLLSPSGDGYLYINNASNLIDAYRRKGILMSESTNPEYSVIAVRKMIVETIRTLLPFGKEKYYIYYPMITANNECIVIQQRLLTLDKVPSIINKTITSLNEKKADTLLLNHFNDMFGNMIKAGDNLEKRNTMATVSEDRMYLGMQEHKSVIKSIHEAYGKLFSDHFELVRLIFEKVDGTPTTFEELKSYIKKSPEIFNEKDVQNGRVIWNQLREMPEYKLLKNPQQMKAFLKTHRLMFISNDVSRESIKHFLDNQDNLIKYGK